MSLLRMFSSVCSAAGRSLDAAVDSVQSRLPEDCTHGEDPFAVTCALIHIFKRVMQRHLASADAEAAGEVGDYHGLCSGAHRGAEQKVFHVSAKAKGYQLIAQYGQMRMADVSLVGHTTLHTRRFCLQCAVRCCAAPRRTTRSTSFPRVPVRSCLGLCAESPAVRSLKQDVLALKEEAGKTAANSVLLEQSVLGVIRKLSKLDLSVTTFGSLGHKICDATRPQPLSTLFPRLSCPLPPDIDDSFMRKWDAASKEQDVQVGLHSSAAWIGMGPSTVLRRQPF